MHRKELAQWHRDQAEILDSGKPLEGKWYEGGWAEGWVKCDGDSKLVEYRLAPERKPIPDYDLTESEVKALIDTGYTQIAQDEGCEVCAYGMDYGCGYFYTKLKRIDNNRYTGSDWRESLRTLKDYV